MASIMRALQRPFDFVQHIPAPSRLTVWPALDRTRFSSTHVRNIFCADIGVIWSEFASKNLGAAGTWSGSTHPITELDSPGGGDGELVLERPKTHGVSVIKYARLSRPDEVPGCHPTIRNLACAVEQPSSTSSSNARPSFL